MATKPAEWMPWNYRETLERIVSTDDQQTLARTGPGARKSSGDN
jgi:hypothetical protein